MASKGDFVALSTPAAQFPYFASVSIYCKDLTRDDCWVLHRRVVLCNPCGLRFSSDGHTLAVASNRDVAFVRVSDGSVQDIVSVIKKPTCIHFTDVNEYRQGWLVSSLNCLYHVENGCAVSIYVQRVLPKLTLVPGLGLCHVELDAHGVGHVRFWDSQDEVAMDTMSAAKTQWMVAVVRVAIRREFSRRRVTTHH